MWAEGSRWPKRACRVCSGSRWSSRWSTRSPPSPSYGKTVSEREGEREGGRESDQNQYTQISSCSHSHNTNQDSMGDCAWRVKHMHFSHISKVTESLTYTHSLALPHTCTHTHLNADSVNWPLHRTSSRSNSHKERTWPMVYSTQFICFHQITNCYMPNYWTKQLRPHKDTFLPLMTSA